jgi:hypothetical protein
VSETKFPDIIRDITESNNSRHRGIINLLDTLHKIPSTIQKVIEAGLV